MSNLNYKEFAEYLQGESWDYRENQDVKEILDLIALILADDSVKRMKNASADPTVQKGGGADMG